tara:strand:- start:5415 stop:8000 length:2586 start_codon:yes stop_codon:yes gene_type:complete
MAQNPQQVQDLLNQIEAVYRRIGETNPFKNFNTSAFTDVNDAVRVLEQGLISSRRRLNELVNDAGELVSSFRAIVSEVKSGNIALSATTKSFNGLTSIASKIQSDQAGINVLRKKELQSLQKQFEQEQLNLKTNKDALVTRARELRAKKESQGLTAAEQKELTKVITAYQSTVSLLGDQDSAMAELNRKLGERLEREEKIEKAMGLGGAAIGAANTALSKLGLGGLADKLGLDKVNEKMREMSETLTEGGTKTATFKDKMSVLKGGIKEAGKNLVENLKDPLAIATLLAKEFVTALINGDKATGELAKGLNISYQAASRLRDDLNTVANLTGDANVNTRGLQESLMAVGRTLGSNAKLNKEDLITFTKLREQSGMTNENLAAMQRFTLVTGGTLEGNTKEFLAQAQITAQNNGVVLNTKQLLEETANVSDAIKLSAGGTAGGFAKAAAQVKALGLSLEKVDDIAGSLLQFEDSITSELEAELLIGRDLTLEKARQAALDGDLATVAEEISKQVGKAADFTTKGRIQQEALAKAVGMSRDDLAKTLVEREALAGLSGEEAKAGKETFDNLVKRYDVETATQMIKEKGFKTLMDQQSVQEKFNKGIEKLREVFISIAQPVLAIVDPIIDLLIPALQLIPALLAPITDTFKGISGILTGSVKSLSTMEKVMGGIGIAALFYLGITKSIAVYEGIIAMRKANALVIDEAMLYLEASKKAGILSTIGALTIQLGIQLGLLSAALATNAAVTGGVGVAVAVAAAAAGYAAIKAITADDMVSPGSSTSGYGKRTLFGPEGAIQLNNKDTIIAGTNLGGGSAGSDIGPLVLEMQNVRAVLQQILAKEGSVYIDSTKAGTAFAVGTSKLQ